MEFPFPSTPSRGINFDGGDPISHGVNLGVVHGEVVLDADVVLSPEIDLIPYFPYNPLLVVVVVALCGSAYVCDARAEVQENRIRLLRNCTSRFCIGLTDSDMNMKAPLC